MITAEKFRNLALSLAGATEQPHFEKTSFRINKKISFFDKSRGAEKTRREGGGKIKN